MAKTPAPDNTQPEEAPPRPPCIFEKSQTVYIKRHQVNIGGVKVGFGGMAGKFINTSYGPTGEEYITIYHDGFRTFALEHARKKKGSRASITGSTAGGKLVVECAGLEGQPCTNTREISGSDKHLVKRCKDCQKTYAKITNRERMRKRRAERKNESKKKEMGGDS